MAGSGLGGRREVSLYFGAGLELMRNAGAVSSEQICLGRFGTWEDFRVHRGLPVFLRTVVMVWSTRGARLST